MMEFWLLIFLFLRIFLHCIVILFSLFFTHFLVHRLLVCSIANLLALVFGLFSIALAILGLKFFFPFFSCVSSFAFLFYHNLIFSFVHSFIPSTVSGCCCWCCFCWWMFATVLLFAAPRYCTNRLFLSPSLLLWVSFRFCFIWISNQSTTRSNVCYVFFFFLLIFGLVSFYLVCSVCCACVLFVCRFCTHTHTYTFI